MPRGLKGGFVTHWQVMGQGPRAALAIHCSLAHSGAWAGVARALGSHMTVTAFDLPGHGSSGAWKNKGEIQAVSTAMAADLLDGPADIIGHSFGATVALRLAATHPHLVRSLSLYEPVFFAVALTDQPQLRAGHEAEMAEYRAGLATGDMRSAARGFLRVWGDGGGWDALPGPARTRIAAQMPLIDAAASALYEDAGGMLASGALERITIPTLLMQGARSPAIIGAINEGLAARLPDCRCATISGADHMGPISRPQAVAKQIANFLGIPARSHG